MYPDDQYCCLSICGCDRDWLLYQQLVGCIDFDGPSKTAFGFVVVQVMTVLHLHSLLLLAIQILAGVIVYVGIGYVLRIESQRELMKLGLRLVKNQKIC